MSVDAVIVSKRKEELCAVVLTWLKRSTRRKSIWESVARGSEVGLGPLEQL